MAPQSYLSPDLIRFAIDRKDLAVGVFRLFDLEVSVSQPEFEVFEQEIFSEIRLKLSLEQIRDHPLFRSYRDLYWSFGMDPTKLRVSSEALVRRVLNNQNLWRINDVVDVANLASAYHGLPIGLIDESKVDDGLVVRIARRGERFRRIGGAEITCRGREIVLADASKIVCYGFATFDSDFTKVTNSSSSVLLLIYGSPAVTVTTMKEALASTARMVSRWITCKVSDFSIYYSCKLS